MGTQTTDKKLQKLVIAAMFAAVVTVATIVIQIPSPMSGYVNMGDLFVLLSAWMLGPVYGTAAAAIGSALADIITSYAYYAPGTFVIKGLMALAAYALLMVLVGEKSTGVRKIVGYTVSAVAAEAIMVGGYFLYASLILGRGLAAASSIPGNLVQGAFGIVASVFVIGVTERTGLRRRIMQFKHD